MHLKILLILVTFLPGKYTCFSQSKDFLFKKITVNEGLSHNSVLDIAQDTLGYMWFATPEGLNRYNGSDFKIFPKSFDNKTSSENYKRGKLLLDGNNLWMITKGGNLEILDLATEKFTFLKNFQNGDAIPAVRCIFIEDNNRIWIGTEEDGLFLTNREFEIIKHFSTEGNQANKLISNVINRIFKDSKKRIWILTDNGVHESSEINTLHLEGITPLTIAENRFGDIWLGTREKGLYWMNRKYKEFSPIVNPNYPELPSGIPSESILFEDDILSAGNYRVWVGTTGLGLFISEERNITKYIPDRLNPYSIGSKDITSIFKDQKGGIWIGTDGGGLSFYHETFSNLKILSNYDLPENNEIEKITAITTDAQGRLWFNSSGSKLIRYDPGLKKFDFFDHGIQSINNNYREKINALYADEDEHLWVALRKSGIKVLDTETGKIIKSFAPEADLPVFRLPATAFNCFLPENSNMIWAGSQSSGLFLLDKNSGIVQRFSEPESVQDNILALTRISDSTIAVGYEEKGIKLFNTRAGVFKPVAKKFIEDCIDEVPVSSLYYLNDWLWAGTEGKGIMATNLKTGVSKLFSDKDGLPNNIIYGILPEDSRKIWVSSNSGLFRLTYKKPEGDLQIEELNLFHQLDWIQSSGFTSGAFHKAADNTFYFGGTKGINHFKTEEFNILKNESQVIISGLMIDNRSIENDISVSYLNHLNLSFNQNSIAFNYTALNFISHENLNYFYQLEGYDENWINAGTRKYTSYTNLPPGDYKFKVKLADNFLTQAPVTTLGISVKSPLWKTWWFILLLILSASGILYLIYYNRINQLLALQKVKDVISADLHDDLGARLTSIHLLSAISKSRFETNPDINKFLKKIDKEVSASSEALDEIVWNIRMADESLNDIIAKIRRYAGEMFESCNIRYIIKTPDDLGPFKLRMQKRRELFLICKELINNVLKHSQAGWVQMEISIESNKLMISLGDDGKGFDPDQITHRNGICNIKKRIQRLSGRIDIASEIGEGSMINIWIPFDSRNYFHRIYKDLFGKGVGSNLPHKGD